MVVAMQAGISRVPSMSDHQEAAQFTALAEKASGVFALEQFLPVGFNLIFIGVFVAIFVSSEFGFGTMKNTLSRGAERIKVFFSKFIVCSGAALVMLFLFL